MADAIGASRRTMHRAFKDLFGVGPKGYLRLVRLHRFRQSLLQGPDACVTDAALDAGLGHFGRAARYYREQFGELPRDTLERTAQTRTLSPTP
ncbi:MAG: helix-turn-helix domain-containing protein [Marinibacterium sp.]|nr:helix-turn-helix domain-containing protein [Marinibacterium sp.]